ncbi:MFS transporter [Rugosimonospora africana]|uniref:MFS transporter n=1 Tax=Rugosimonospora africana TaxID=556532 RepID=A0A8J3R259_9ACTN|nr:MFS transporter [Rugosimonospora africana]GIH21600.1 MFS transporter [Rugosimonospora africana]
MASHDLAERTTEISRAGRQRAVTLVALSLTFALVQLDATIVNVALQTLRTDLGGGVSAAQWAVDGYAVPFAACMLTAGALGDRYGHRRICLLGFGLFGLASAAAALADGWPVLIGARVAQGAGAALMFPASLAMITGLYPEPRERSRALGVWGGIATLGFASGPLLGGVLITVASWPAIFWINLPVAAMVGGTIAVLGPRDRPQARRIHPGGTVLGTLALASLTAGIIEAGERRMATAVGALALGIVAGWLFTRLERRSANPLVPAGLTGSVSFRWSLVTGFCFNFAMYGALLCVSLTLQSAYGLSALAGGLAVLPMAVVVGVAAISGGFIAAATGPRRPMLLGFTCAGAGAIVTAAGGLAGSSALIVTGLAVIGLCCLAMPAMTSVALNASPARHAGLAGGSFNTARQIGGAIGVALLGAVLNAGGVRTGFTVALGIAAAASAVALLSTVEATARNRRAGPGGGRS